MFGACSLSFGCVTTKMTRLGCELRISDLGAAWLFEMNYSEKVNSTLKPLMFHWSSVFVHRFVDR